MTGMLPRKGKIGNLVLEITRLGKHILKERILPGNLGIFRFDVIPLVIKRRQHAARLQRHAVGRYVLRRKGSKRHSRLKGTPPRICAKAAETEYQINADIVEPGLPQHHIRLESLRRIMPPVHPFENPVVKRLDTHTYTIDTQFFQPGQPRLAFGRYVIRVHFNRDLFESGQVKGGTHGTENPPEHVEGQQGGRSAAQIQCLYRTGTNSLGRTGGTFFTE